MIVHFRARMLITCVNYMFIFNYLIETHDLIIYLKLFYNAIVHRLSNNFIIAQCSYLLERRLVYCQF